MSDEASIQRELTECLKTLTAAQEASTRDLAIARDLRKIVNAPPGEAKVLAEVSHERRLQDAKHGDVDAQLSIPLTMGGPIAAQLLDASRSLCEHMFSNGRGNWCVVLLEEVAEVLAESDPAKVRAELIQVAAVAVRIVEAIDKGAK